jgi:hypothetical protein
MKVVGFDEVGGEFFLKEMLLFGTLQPTVRSRLGDQVQYNDSSLTVEACRDEKVHDLELSDLTPKQLGDLVQCMYANTTDLLVDPIQTHWNLGLYKKLISANSGPKLFSPSQRLYPTRTVAVYYTTLPKIPLPRIFFFFCLHKREIEFKLVTSSSLNVVPID